jgi:hypothetical protein
MITQQCLLVIVLTERVMAAEMGATTATTPVVVLAAILVAVVMAAHRRLTTPERAVAVAVAEQVPHTTLAQAAVVLVCSVKVLMALPAAVGDLVVQMAQARGFVVVWAVLEAAAVHMAAVLDMEVTKWAQAAPVVFELCGPAHLVHSHQRT